jgi:hypothetical protein
MDSGPDIPSCRCVFWPTGGPNVLGAIALVPNLGHVRPHLTAAGGSGDPAAG